MTLPLLHKGKVRDVYDAGDGRLLMVTSDRISAFDVVMVEPIPDKGRVLTAMTAHWLAEVGDIVPNHLISTDVAEARALGRTGVSVDLSMDYSRLAQWRIHRSGHFAKAIAKTNGERQGSLLDAPALAAVVPVDFTHAETERVVNAETGGLL